MSKEKREDSIPANVRNDGLFEPEPRKKFWVMCAWYGFLLTIIFITVHIVNSAKGQSTGSLFSSQGDQLSSPSAPSHDNWQNLLVEESSNYTSTLAHFLLLNATASSESDCYGASTYKTQLEGLPEAVDWKVFLQTDRLHRLTLVAYAENGERRCAGGDYYEVDFHDSDNVRYRSRLPTTDFGNGSYGLELLVPSRFAGPFTLEIFILYGNWHGMDSNPSPWVRKDLVLAKELEMIPGEESHDLIGKEFRNPVLKQCTQADFDRTTWQGRWTRSWHNTSCAPDKSTKRYQCLPEEHYSCEEPWCFGNVGRLDSNGWQYSAHCSFKIFEREEAWKCLEGRWFMVWGDSNFQDTIRNLLLFILEWKLPSGHNLADYQLARTYEMVFMNSYSYDQLFRVSQVFNGAHIVSRDHEGLLTLTYKEHQELLLAHFNGTRWPDTIIMNSGLHDGTQYSTIEAYSEAADFMIDFWMTIYKSLPAERRPQMIWRATVAPAGAARDMPSNPNKMEMFNHIMAEKLQTVHDQMPVKFVDAFDLTFPFHYDNNFSDGGHYGRAPGADLWPWFRQPHWYFVDIMLGHILLNALCPST